MSSLLPFSTREFLETQSNMSNLSNPRHSPYSPAPDDGNSNVANSPWSEQSGYDSFTLPPFTTTTTSSTTHNISTRSLVSHPPTPFFLNHCNLRTTNRHLQINTLDGTPNPFPNTASRAQNPQILLRSSSTCHPPGHPQQCLIHETPRVRLQSLISRHRHHLSGTRRHRVGNARQRHRGRDEQAR